MSRGLHRGVMLLLGAIAAVPSACGSSGGDGGRSGACVAGATQECVGTAACRGGQVCTDSGTWGPCDCGSGGGGSDASVGGTQGTGGGPQASGGAGQTGGGSNAGGSNTGGSNTGGSNTGGSNTGGSNTGGSNTGGSNTGGSVDGGDASQGTGGGGQLDGACDGSAAKRADVIFVIDNSGSMTEEAAAVQNNMNAFAQQFIDAGIDLHVVVVSAPQCGSDLLCGITYSTLFNGVCIPTPFGSTAPGAACPNGTDSNPPSCLHVSVGVDSHNALAQLQNTYSKWQPMLRADAAKTFVVITDDEANATPSAAEFQTWVDAQPEFQSAVWRFSGIYCQTGSSNCAAIGTTYDTLVAATGGVKANLGTFGAGVDSQFALAFGSIATAVQQDALAAACQ